MQVVLWATRRVSTTYSSRKRLNEESLGLLLGEVGELLAVGTGKAEVLVPPLPQFSPMRPHRPLYLVKGFKEDKEVSPGAKDRVTDYLRAQSMQARETVPSLPFEVFKTHLDKDLSKQIPWLALL